MQSLVENNEEIVHEVSFEEYHMSPDIDLTQHDKAVKKNRDWSKRIIAKQLWRINHENL